jgi:NADH:ubiquinone oxidoreductase subunit 6 (subunit J)
MPDWMPSAMFVGAIVALVVVVVLMIRSLRVRREAQTKEGWLGTQPIWVRFVGLLVLAGGAYILFNYR